MNEGIIEVLLADIWFQCHSGQMILVPQSTVNEGFTNRISCATVFSRQSLLGQSTSMLITLITLSGGQEHNVLTITTKDGIYLSTTVSVPTAHWLRSLQAHVLHMTVLRVDRLKQGRYLESREGNPAQQYVFLKLHQSLANQSGRLLEYLLIDHSYEANGMFIFLHILTHFGPYIGLRHATLILSSRATFLLMWWKRLSAGSATTSPRTQSSPSATTSSTTSV